MILLGGAAQAPTVKVATLKTSLLFQAFTRNQPAPIGALGWRQPGIRQPPGTIELPNCPAADLTGSNQPLITALQT